MHLPWIYVPWHLQTLGSNRMIYYKIRYKDNIEKYVTGTPTYTSSDSIGRIFQSLGSLRTFLTGVMKRDSRQNSWDTGSRNRLSEWEIVEIEMVIKDIKGVHEVITQKKLIEMLTK